MIMQSELDDPNKLGHSPLAALLAVMEQLHTPVEDVIATMDAPFAAYRAPDPFVALLSMWVDLAWLLLPSPDGVQVPLPGGVGRLRNLVDSASELSAQRGTATGLTRFLEVALGTSPVEVLSDPDRPFAATVRVPAALQGLESIIRRMIDDQKPAHLSYVLTFSDSG
jgi:phage tail-like protein